VSPLRFLKRRARLVAFLVSLPIGLAAAVALDPRVGLRGGTAAYTALLGLALGATYLAADFLRSGRYYGEMERLARLETPLLDLEPPIAPKGESQETALLLARMRKDAYATIALSRRASREDVEFIAAWVHELKTPVSVLRLMAESGSLDPAEALAEIGRIEDRLRKALGYARSSDFASDSIMDDCDCEQATREVLRRLARAFIAKDIRPSLRGPWFRVRSDPKWLDFILEQLLSNAAKYSRRGGEVRIRMERDEAKVRLYVEDEGQGIRTEDLDRLFSRNFTGANGRKDLSASGLGLYLTKKLADRLGHGIAIESEEGRGTRVILCFPRLSDWHEPSRSDLTES
jgi:signal transduction histidine kinase